jgi:hypothetical protein
MSTRLTLLFVCDRSYLYSNLIEEFRTADFQVLIARNLAQAKSALLARSINFIVLCHDWTRDDRPLAASLKGAAPQVPVFLFTDQEETRLPADIDSVWRVDLRDELLTRGMAVFFRRLFSPREASLRPSLVVGGAAPPLFVGLRANGSR